jgi:hypothetical protein
VDRARPNLSLEHLVSTRGSAVHEPADIAGATPAGALVVVTVGPADPLTLAVFLGSQCEGCADLWDALGDPVSFGLAPGDRVIGVTRQAPFETPTLIAGLVPGGATVVMSTTAWGDYRVQAPPYFMLISTAPFEVLIEGVPFGREHVLESVRRVMPERRSGSGVPNALD